MSDFLSRIKSFFVESEKRPFSQFCSDYLKIKAELAVSDVKISGRELNFKISWRGSVVPFWVSSKLAESLSHLPERSEGREMNGVQRTPPSSTPSSLPYEVSDIVPIIAAGLAFGLNLVEISQELKNYGIDS